MDSRRIHRAVSPDGTEVAGRVHGHGPPLVLVHGALYDGDTAWAEMLPHLTDHFTCFLPSTRGRGLSGSSPDCSPPRQLEDVIAYVDSIGEPVPVMGWSGGGMWALGTAAHSDAVSAVVAYEPAVLDVLGDDGFTRVTETVGRMRKHAGDGRLFDAARSFCELVTTDEELAAVIASGRLASAMPNIGTDLRMFEQMDPTAGPTPTDPALLAGITVPVLLLLGDSTAWRWFDAAVRHVAAHVPECEVRTVAGAGHSAPGVMPGAVAGELLRFLSSLRQPA